MSRLIYEGYGLKVYETAGGSPPGPLIDIEGKTKLGLKPRDAAEFARVIMRTAIRLQQAADAEEMMRL